MSHSSSPQPHQPVSHYEATAHRDATYSPLEGHHTCDVCVIGGGIAGSSAALHLAERGYRVMLVEAAQIGWGASGRSGGQIIPGYSCEQSTLDALVGRAEADRLWALSVDAVQLTRALIERHRIDCDWRPGHLQAAIKPRHRAALIAWRDQLLQRYRYSNVRLLERAEMRDALATERYCAGLLDADAGHLHPLNYTLGLAAAAAQAGAQIFEQSAALEIATRRPATIRTPQGQITAEHVVLCGNAYLGGLVPNLRTRIMPVATYIVATQTLGEERARALIPGDQAVADCNFILDYFRRSADHRLLFGGRVSYSGHDAFSVASATRARIIKVFPQLADVKIDSAWSGLLDITMNRAPDFGRIADHIYYLQGFSGHGLALAGMAGKLAAEAIAGQAERFDAFGRIKHHRFPGGPLLRMPILVAAMLWRRLLDVL